MRPSLSALLVLAIAGPTGSAWAEPEDPWADDATSAEWVQAKQEEIGPWSTQSVDPAGLSKWSLITAATFSDGSSPFSGATAWAFEARGQVRLTKGLALTGVVPVGLTTRDGLSTRAFLGNVGLGVGFGGVAHEVGALKVRWGAALDIAAPTASLPDQERVAVVRSTVAAIRGRAPHLYLPRLLSFWGRGHVDVTHGMFTGELELGLAPSSMVGEFGGFAMLGSLSLRASARVNETFEPYLDISGMRHLSGALEVTPPLWITPGVRLHVSDGFQPAIFLGLNFVEATALVIGVDLAGIVRPRVGKAKPDDADDFMDF